MWSEEIIASKISACSRAYNARTGAVEFLVKSGGHAVFETIPARERVIFQLGCSSAGDAVRAAEVVWRDVTGIDVNMGCDKHAAVSCGMGAALGSDPAAAADIIKSLVRNIPSQCPITSKIRLQDDPRRTLELVKALQLAGVSAITVHCRKRGEGPAHPADWRALRPIVEAVDVPIIGNGDVFCVHSAFGMLRAAGAQGGQGEGGGGQEDEEDGTSVCTRKQLSGVMLARGALRDCRVFSDLCHARSR